MNLDNLTSTYGIWKNMRQRCFNKRNPNYKRYGARGISIHKSWDDFDVFLADMGIRPKNHSIDRIDNNKDYGPANCKWSNRTEQARNTRKTQYVTIEGQTKPLREWAEISGVNFVTIFTRIFYRNWNPARAIFTKARRLKGRNYA